MKLVAILTVAMIFGVCPAGFSQQAGVNSMAIPESPGMTLLQATILGVVEGVTEYLPVSSTGHLIVAQKLMGIADSEAIKAFEICIQAGAIAAVLGLYFPRVIQMLLGVLGRSPAGRAMAINVIVGVLPALAIGAALDKKIKEHLFGPWPVVIAWFVGGAAILIVAAMKRKKSGEANPGSSLEQLGWKMALMIGFAQCIAMWPGTSRSLITIVGGAAAGLSLPASVEFSFLLGVITLGAATAHDALKHGKEMLDAFGPAPLGVGFLAAAISAALAVRWMVSYLRRHGLWIFGWYRIAIAGAVTAMIWLRWI